MIVVFHPKPFPSTNTIWSILKINKQFCHVEIPVEEDQEEESAAVDGDEAQRDALDIDMEEEELDSATGQGPSRASSNVH